jgi:transcriptional regulator GlxA family with amidase domain
VQIAVALSPGVSADECEAFTAVFEQLADVELVRVASALGRVPGPGGGQEATATFDDVLEPDVVVVPGGLGCSNSAADDELGDWLRGVAPVCRWMVASSTGTVVVAAAGLLDGRSAATHWLASPLLASYGSDTSPDRVVEVGNIITCEGHITAMHVALLVTLRLGGPEAVGEVRAGLARAGTVDTTSDQPWWARWTRWTRWTGRFAARRPSGPARPTNRELVAPDVIEFDPVIHHR